MKKENKSMKKVNDKNKEFCKVMTEDHDKLNKIIDKKETKLRQGSIKIMNLIEAKTDKEHEAEELNKEKE